jgi:hypothetical protein
MLARQRAKINLAESGTIVVLTLVRLFNEPCKPTFTIDSKDYEWKGSSSLLDKKTNSLFAQYFRGPRQ